MIDKIIFSLNFRRIRDLCSSIKNTFEPVIQTNLYPKSQITISLQVLQHDGCKPPPYTTFKLLLILIQPSFNPVSTVPHSPSSLPEYLYSILSLPSQSDFSPLPSLPFLPHSLHKLKPFTLPPVSYLF
jgi:hypothetical protein